MAEHQAAGLRGRDIVCLGSADWQGGHWTNQQHLMYRLAGDNQVLFIESLGLRKPQIKAMDVRRLARRARSTFQGMRLLDGVNVMSPPVLPFHANRLVRALNARLLAMSVSRATRRIGMSRPILWAYVPQAEALVDTLAPVSIVYHCVDDIAAQKGVDAAGFRESERRFASRAGLVITSSSTLTERMGRISDNVLEAPNVADTALFSTALESGPIDPDLEAVPEPRIVFVGAITATKLDFGLLTDLAQMRPDWSLVLVGPVGLGDPSTDISRLEALTNVHILGPRRQSELPDVLRGAAVGMIPYRTSDLTASIFPMKVYEYLAAGLPVVSTRLPALAEVTEIARAGDAVELAARIEDELSQDSPALRLERSRAAAGHSWEVRLEQLDEAVRKLDARA
jgi:glycosyltransferase involved in cell wall biosynthesis